MKEIEPVVELDEEEDFLDEDGEPIKSEDGETPEECMARELKEELEIEAEIGILITSNKHRYPNGIFELLVYKVEHISGNFVLNDHDEIKWITIDEISKFDFPPANTPIINYLKNAYE